MLIRKATSALARKIMPIYSLIQQLREAMEHQASADVAPPAPTGPASLVSTNIPSQRLSSPLPPISHLVDRSTLVDAIRSSINNNKYTVQGQLLSGWSDDALLAHVDADRSPIPAIADRESYAGNDHLRYWLMGLADATYINHLIKTRLGKDEQDEVSILDFGGASGRVVRHLDLTRPSGRIICSDINPNNIGFVRAYLPERITPLHNVVFPPFPVADNSVDFLYGLSVFTHISDFEEAWLSEIKRVLRKGGVAFLTVHTERTFSDMKPGHFLHDMTVNGRYSAEGIGYYIPLADNEFFKRDGFGERLVLTNLDWPVNNTNIFHHTDYIRRKWGAIFDVEDIIQSAHGGHQDGIILRA